MFLGFDETTEHIEKIYSCKIPIINILITPYVILIFCLSVIVSLFAWLFGFWRCNHCHNIFPFWKDRKVAKYYYGYDSTETIKHCKKCQKIKEKRK